MANMDSIYGYSDVDFITNCWIIFDSLCDDLYNLFYWLYTFTQCQVWIIFVMKSVYEFDWYSCDLVWNIFQMACFVPVRVYRIDVNCIQTTELRNDKSVWKPPSMLVCNKNSIWMLLLFLGTLKTFRYLMNAGDANIISLLLHNYNG